MLRVHISSPLPEPHSTFHLSPTTQFNPAMKTLALIAMVGYAASASALTINFVNKCKISTSTSV